MIIDYLQGKSIHVSSKSNKRRRTKDNLGNNSGFGKWVWTGAEPRSPLGGGGGGGLYRNFNWAPPMMYIPPPPLSYFCSIHSQAQACSSFNCRPLLSFNKTKHGPLIFKYPKALPNKITLYHPFFCYSFYSLLVFCVDATAHSIGTSSPQTK